jgi:hypothetical protein
MIQPQFISFFAFIESTFKINPFMSFTFLVPNIYGPVCPIKLNVDGSWIVNEVGNQDYCSTDCLK